MDAYKYLLTYVCILDIVIILRLDVRTFGVQRDRHARSNELSYCPDKSNKLGSIHFR
jgi:hypothetical protein